MVAVDHAAYRADMTRLRAGQIGVVLAALLLTAACSGGAGGGDEDDAASDDAAVEPADDATDEPTDADTTDADDPTDTDAAAGPSADDLATGWVLVETTEYPLNGGQCQFLRLDGEEVLDLRAEEVSATIAVDSTGGDGNDEEGDIALRSGSNTFDLEGDVSGSGTWSAVAEAGWTPLRENARVAEVGFIGTLDDGRPVTASLICLVEW